MIGLAVVALVAVQAEPKVLRRPPHYADRPTQYEQLVAQYQRGEYDSAVARAARTPAKAFEKPFEDALSRLWYDALLWKSRKASAHGTLKDWYDAEDRLLRFLLAVRMLHTEAAFRAPLEQMADHLTLARTADTTIERAQRDLDPHAEPSSYLTAEKLARGRHDWVVFIALGYHVRAVLDDFPKFITEALQRYPQDPTLELCLGLYDERIARYSVVDESLARTIYPSDHVASWRHGLQSALSAYEQAARGPDLSVETQLRMGRIHLQLNDLKQARETLEPLAASAEAPLVKYLALILLGAVEELTKNSDAALARYRDAMGLFPTAQAPFIAMSRLLDERGDVSGAREWLERSFALPTAQRVDPWSVYYFPFIDMRPIAVALREQVRP
jgi:tetratricopeptide (TPR) repeat protein